MDNENVKSGWGSVIFLVVAASFFLWVAMGIDKAEATGLTFSEGGANRWYPLSLCLGLGVLLILWDLVRTRRANASSGEFLKGVKCAEELMLANPIDNGRELEADIDTARVRGCYTDFDRGIACYLQYYEANHQVIKKSQVGEGFNNYGDMVNGICRCVYVVTARGQ